jgi:hypothetical protein
MPGNIMVGVSAKASSQTKGDLADRLFYATEAYLLRPEGALIKQHKSHLSGLKPNSGRHWINGTYDIQYLYALNLLRIIFHDH